MNILGKILLMPVMAFWWILVLFVSGLIYPWEDVDFYATAIPGRILGSVVCSILFGIVGFFYGWTVPWTEEFKRRIQ